MIEETNKGIVHDCKYKIAFCPKYRKPVLTKEVGSVLSELLISKAAELGSEIIEIIINENSVQLLIACDTQFGIHKVVKGLKSSTSRKLRERFPHLKSTMPSMWTNTYYCSTVGTISTESIESFIESQEVRTSKK